VRHLSIAGADETAAAWALRTRLAQGIPADITDTAALRQIAALLGEALKGGAAEANSEERAA